MQYQQPINHWAVEDRPREKLVEKGPEALTEAELIAILIGSGTPSRSAVAVGRELIEHFGGLHRLARCTLREMTTIKGIGPAKAISIVAAFELAKRKQLTEVREVFANDPAIVAAYLSPRMTDLDHEIFYVLFLNRRNQIIGEKRVSSGGSTSTVIDPKIIFREALNLMATGLIISHNHPSGSLQPSGTDIALTIKLKEGANWFDIQLLDHIIIAGAQYYSFAENKQL
ncbi:MAG: DNA repair protein RadC [Bacteroidetes bacterium]|jgi:DNA repair protein RadC|nr:DNA repair protein RadC [Bacteroidota bacterium]